MQQAHKVFGGFPFVPGREDGTAIGIMALDE